MFNVLVTFCHSLAIHIFANHCVFASLRPRVKLSRLAISHRVSNHQQVGPIIFLPTSAPLLPRAFALNSRLTIQQFNNSTTFSILSPWLDHGAYRDPTVPRNGDIRRISDMRVRPRQGPCALRASACIADSEILATRHK